MPVLGRSLPVKPTLRPFPWVIPPQPSTGWRSGVPGTAPVFQPGVHRLGAGVTGIQKIGASQQFTSGSVTTAVNQIVLTLTKTVMAGDRLLGALSTTSPGSLISIASIVDVRGNTWSLPGSGSTQEPEQFNGTTSQVHIFSCLVTKTLLSGDTVTITLAASATVTRWDAQLDDFFNIAAMDVKQVNTGSTASMTTGSTATTAKADELVYAAFAFGLGSSQVATHGTGFSDSGQINTTVGTTDRALFVEWDIVSSQGAQQASAQLNLSSTWAAAIATYPTTSIPTPGAGSVGPNFLNFMPF